MTMDPAMAIEVAAMSRQRALEQATARGDSEIQGFYCGSTVCLTGGSGFMGKQMVEKLFRTFELSKVYLLLRSRKGKTIQERLTEMLQDPVFDTVQKLKPDFAQKIVAIEGDVAEIRLGISDLDWKTLSEEVDVIYHMAATTRFDERLRMATLINVRGTREALTLGRACRKLKSFVHVSTAYTQALTSLIDQQIFEEFPECPITPETLISMAETVEETRLDGITANLIQDWPNTYTFAKALAEDVIRTSSNGLPICIIRPGIVAATHHEPTPGWIDISCAYGATGLLIGLGLGVLHVMLDRFHVKIGLVPCDYVNNAIIAAGRQASSSNGGESTKIYTVSSVSRNPIQFGELPSIMRNNRNKLTSPKAFYYNYGFETSHRWMFTFLTWFLHLIPAYVVDFICLLLGQERRLVKIYNKVYKMSNALSYFTLNSWLFDDRNLEGLFKGLSKTDKVILNFDIPSLNWEEYVKIWCVGVRKYIVKDGLRGTVKGNRRQFYLRIIHYLLTVLYLYCFWKLFCFLYYVCKSVIFLINI